MLMSVSTVVILAALSGAPDLPALGFYGGATIVTGGAFAVVGIAIAMRAPGHPMGWVALGIAFSQSLGSLASAWATYGFLVAAQPPPLADLASWLSLWAWGPGIWLLVGLTYLFPEGRPVRRAQWSLAALSVVGMPLMIVPYAIVGWAYRGLVLVPGELPAGMPGVDAALALQSVGVVLNLVVAIGGTVYLVVRFRGSGGVERQQRKWFASAAIVFVALLWVAPFGSLGPIPDLLIGAAGGSVLPAAIGIAILRYHLYDIDRIVSRTVSWALVTGALIAVFAVVVLVLESLLNGVTQGQTLAVAASTLAAASLFQPVRGRVQRAVDRRFDRAAYDRERTAGDFADRLRGEVDLDAVGADLRATATGAINPRGITLWLRRRASES